MGELKLQGYPNDRQKDFFIATTRHIGYGGARGGGKSWAMRRKFVLLALKYPKLKLLILRRTLQELRENHVMPLLLELNGFAKYKDDEKAFTFPNGSRIKLGYCDNERDVLQYQGQEYDVIGLEEATHFTDTMRIFFTTCNRSTRSDFKPRMYYTSNPGGVGHTWFKRLFIDREYMNKERTEDYVFIPAKVYDNKALMENNPEYVEALENLPDDMREAHLHGNWDVFAGQYFREFKRDVHVIEPFVIPHNWQRFRVLDYGLDMLACYWIAVDTQGHAFVYKECYQPNLIISDAANRVTELTNEQIKITYAPPDLWNRRQDTGKSAAELFQENGITLIQANNERIQGWLNLKEWLKPYEAQDEQTGDTVMTARIKITNNCINLIRTLPQLQHDEKEPNDVADQPHELTHAPDALRYFCSMRTLPTVLPKPLPDMSMEARVRRNIANMGKKKARVSAL